MLGSHTALAVADRPTVLEVDLICVKGKREPERVFTRTGGADLRAAPQFRERAVAHGRMLDCDRAQDWDGAEAALAAARARAGGFALTPLHALYAERIAAFRAAPPGPGWDAVYEARTK